MKKLVLFSLLLVFSCVCAILYSHYHNGNTKNVNVIIENSKIFDKVEIEDAISEVEKAFRSYYGCSMTKIWYDETLSDKYNTRYTNVGIAKENVILILCDFNTSNVCPAGLKQNSKYHAYQWFLARDAKNKQWHIEENGY